jgi:hypothetical protein
MAQLAYLLQPKPNQGTVKKTTLLKVSCASNENKNTESIAALFREGNEDGNKQQTQDTSAK